MPRYTNAQFLEGIKDSAGIISTVARRVGCDWNTAKKRILDNAKLTAAFEHEQQTVNDMAEATVISSIREGNTHDAKWWLARIRKERFSERTEHTGAEGKPVEISMVEIIMPEDDSDTNSD